MKPFPLLAAGLSIFLAASVSRADVWDEGPDSDNTCSGTSDNELIHGSDQVHDLGVRPGPIADEDHYTLTARSYASYEAVIDGTTGDLNNGGNPDFRFERNTGGSCAPVQSFVPVGAWGFSRAIRWEAGPNGEAGGLYVISPACGTGCTETDQYRIRFYETTYSIPRFNNSSSQITILIVQNPTHYSINVTPWFFNGAGTLLASAPFVLPPHGTQTLNTSTMPQLAGQSGSIVISNTGAYGDLAGKAVAVEPTTGFTFDTAMVPRAH